MTREARYLEAMAERSRRKGNGLDFEKSKALILRAAREKHFLSYKQLADESGADWGKVHYAIGGHLWDLVKYAQGKGWPMLSAVVVNQRNLSTGEMDADTLKGFIEAAKALGRSITIAHKEFLEEEQQRVFEWAAASEKNNLLFTQADK
ncbi:hypothetical protein U8Q05_25775 [Rhizobium ruizarguesonis]|nr:hypothetical protein U8Q05_25775 [Rhizobium ruizarguesonis]